ncbi:MAG: hypothetical protein HUU01_04485 [Saprospiraceae bacterium]|nr:hypothetical protein [Saprospiraceae bacterium]
MYFHHQSYLAFLFAACLLLPGINPATAQTAAKSYYFENDEVVFEFDIRLYEKAETDGTSEKLEFSEFNIRQVVVSGDFNKWSEKAWKMKKIGPYTFQLRKKVKDFNDDFTWNFKFLINGRYWADPDNLRVNEKIISDDIWEGVYNLDVYNVQPVEHGNASFFLAGFPDAKEVILSGEFNGWNEHALRMNKVENGWRLDLELPVGRYEYKFIADGQWMHDPANPETVVNMHHTLNSVLRLTKTVVFELSGYPNAEKVILAGTFNKWNEHNTRMERTETGWTYKMNLPAGKHYYKFIVDGKWMIDPANPLSEYDPYGHLNSILLVQ